MLSKEKEAVQQDYNELLDAISATNDLLTGRRSVLGSGPNGSNNQDSQPRSTRN